MSLPPISGSGPDVVALTKGFVSATIVYTWKVKDEKNMMTKSSVIKMVRDRIKSTIVLHW